MTLAETYKKMMALVMPVEWEHNEYLVDKNEQNFVIEANSARFENRGIFGVRVGERYLAPKAIASINATNRDMISSRLPIIFDKTPYVFGSVDFSNGSNDPAVLDGRALSVEFLRPTSNPVKIK